MAVLNSPLRSPLRSPLYDPFNTGGGVPIWIDGDSYATIQGGVGLAPSLQAALNRTCMIAGIGGATLSEASARVQARTSAANNTLVFWDGNSNSYGTYAADMAKYATVAAACPRCIIIPPVRRRSDPSDVITAMNALQTGIALTYGGRTIDAQALLAAAATSPGDDADVAEGYVPRSLLIDYVSNRHLNAAGWAVITAAVLAMLPSIEGGSYEVEASGLFARFTTPANATRKGHINTLIRSLKTAGVWSKLDALYITAAADAQAAQRNWKGDIFNLTPTSSPTFTADRGYAGNGTSSYLATGFTPSTAGGQFVLNSCHVGVWSRTDSDANVIDIGGGSGNPSATMQACWTGSIRGRANDATGSAIIGTNASSLGHSIVGRIDAVNRRAHRNGASALSLAAASITLCDMPITICVLNGVTAFSSRQYAAAHFGAGLTDQNAADLYAALNTYMLAVGAA